MNSIQSVTRLQLERKKSLGEYCFHFAFIFFGLVVCLCAGAGMVVDNVCVMEDAPDICMD